MTTRTTSNSLADKARTLDRYRWLLLRERHGVLGSAVRFMRDALKDWWFGSCAKWRLAGAVSAEPCDFLLLQSAPKVIGFQRKRRFMSELRARGHRLTETALPDIRDMLERRQLTRPAGFVPTRYYGYAAHAEWLVERYQPQVLLNDRNGSLYSPFLREALNRKGRLLVHLAHATTVEASQRLAMNDYDYYFVFGQSSLEGLQARPVRFGSSTVVLAGSHMVDSAYDLPAAKPGEGAILVIGVGPDKEKLPGYQRTYALLAEWAREHPRYRLIVKAHPRSKVPYWQEIASTLSNVQVLPAECSLAEALEQSWVVINVMSNAVIEAALARRPVLFVNASADLDIFKQEDFFGPRISSAQALAHALEEVRNGYLKRLDASIRFADHHLTHGVDGLGRNLDLLEKLLQHQPLSGVSLPQRLSTADAVTIAPASVPWPFDHGYVINLDARPDRWAWLEAHVRARIGVPVNRFSAVSALALGNDTPSPALRLFLERIDGPREDFEHKLRATWACMRSHLAIIARAQAQGWPYVLILEDDCEFAPYTRKVLQTVEKQIHAAPWDLLYLGGTLKKGGTTQHVTRNLKRVSRVRLAHAYVVNASIYQRILDEAPASGLPIDWYYSERLLPTIQALMVVPRLAEQQTGVLSDIEHCVRKPKVKTRQTFERLWSRLRYWEWSR